MPKIWVIYYKCSQLEDLNLSSFNKANSLKELSGMFEECFIGVNLITSNKEINKEMDEVRNKKLKKLENEIEQNEEQNNGSQ